MPSKPIPGSTGEVLTCLPSPYTAHQATGLLWLPRFIAKCKYTKEHGALPASYAKNYKRGIDRFFCMHLGIDPSAVEQVVKESASDEEIETRAREDPPGGRPGRKVEPGPGPEGNDRRRGGNSCSRR